MKAKLDTTLKLHCGQSDSSSFIGRKYRVQDTKYGHNIGEYDMPQDAEKASLARPYSKVVSEPDVASTPAVRDMARRRLVKTNPDIDAGGPGSGRHKEVLEKHNFKLTGTSPKGQEVYRLAGYNQYIGVNKDGSWLHMLHHTGGELQRTPSLKEKERVGKGLDLDSLTKHLDR